MNSPRPRTVHHDVPPPSVVGASPWAYPEPEDARGSGRGPRADARARVAADRRRSGLVALPPGQTLAVRPAWLDAPLFTRTGDEGWTVAAEGLDQLTRATSRVGLQGQMLRRYGGFDDRYLRSVLASALEEYLRAMAWWLPDAVPRANSALAYLYDQLLRRGERLDDGFEVWEDVFPGEHEAADRAAEDRYRDEDYAPWESRASRLYIEQMIVASGRVDPFRLRPLVLITENAGRRQWWYGGWAVYECDTTGRVGQLLAIHGKHARIPNTVVWMTSLKYTGPTPSPEVVRWYGYGFDDWEGQHADVLCAITGVSLYDGTQGMIAAAPRPPEAFVPAVPHALTSLSTEGDVLTRMATPTHSERDNLRAASADVTLTSAAVGVEAPR